MLTAKEALQRILSQIKPIPAQPVPLLHCRGNTLAEDVRSDTDLPPFDNSAVDGYAVRAEDTASVPVVLKEVADIAAGQAPSRAIGPGECARVMTGAPIPPGANAMVMVEDSRRVGDGTVEIGATASSGDHIRPAGGDVRKGSTVLRSGTRLGPAEIAMLAAVGRSETPIYARPRVAVLSTGDELVEPHIVPGPGQIRDSNRFALMAMTTESGAELHSMGHLPDDEAATESALRQLAESADVIVTSGGVSVGDRDFIKPVVERLGTLDLWRVKMKPGKPLAFGKIGKTLFFGLPGNPVSTMVTFELFVRPALWKMMGRTDLDRPRVPAILDQPVKHTPGREEFVRAKLTIQDGKFHVEPTGAQGSGMLTSMLAANALLDIPAESGDLPAGATVQALMIQPV